MNQTDWSQLSPAAMLRDWVVKSEAQWSEAITTLLKDERTGGLLNKQIEQARQMQRMFAEMAQAWLAAANLPSRSDFEALDERLGRLEDGLAGVNAALVQLRAALVAGGAVNAAQAGGNPKLPRNRRPAPARKATRKDASAGS
jgi:BMFP domain-containing protein YqiC